MRIDDDTRNVSKRAIKAVEAGRDVYMKWVSLDWIAERFGIDPADLIDISRSGKQGLMRVYTSKKWSPER